MKLTASLSDEEVERLFHATRDTLQIWIERLAKETGEDFPEKVTAFRPEMAVHGKFGKPCPVCGDPVQRIVYAHNEANYCARCQTEGRLLSDRALSRLLGRDWPKTLEEMESRQAPLSRFARRWRLGRHGGPKTVQPLAEIQWHRRARAPGCSWPCWAR